METIEPARIREMDAADPLAPLRERFALPHGIIYLDGNSLGPLPRTVASAIEQTVMRDWGEGLIRSWNDAGWIDLPGRVGDKIAPLIGAAPGSVMVADSTSLNLFKLLGAALTLRPERRVIVSEAENFPTDLYIAAGLAHLLGRGHHLSTFKADDIEGALDENVAVLLLTEVNYRTGARHDMRALTRRAHEAGALVLWDLAHSAGAFPVDLAGADADFAIGCGYKYLNGGPGAPAFAYVAPRLHAHLQLPISGWMGHARPFAFAPSYEPAQGADALRVGTPPIIGLAALDAALGVFEDVSLAALRQKADALWDLFVREMGERAPELELITPRDSEVRGTQAAFAHTEAYSVMQALIARGVIGDFREPNIVRFGITPLYLRFSDMWHAARIAGEVMANREWERPAFRTRAKVV